MNKKISCSIWGNIRKKSIYLYETKGLDEALNYIKGLNITPNLRAGLKGEIFFFDRFYSSLKLEALLDSGVKADFTGIQKGEMINFDVTTNINYKNIEDYLELIKKKKKQYSIAIVDLESTDIEIFPLKFPICPKCSNFSHYILYKETPNRDLETYISNSQFIFQFCPNCLIRKEIHHFNNIDQTYLGLIDSLEKELNLNLTDDISRNRFLEIFHNNVKEEVQILEKETGLLISGTAEIGYNTHIGDYVAYLSWVHPLVEDIFDIGELWSLDGWKEIDL